MQMIGQLPQSFGLIHGFKILTQPTTNHLFHIPAVSLIQHEEGATTHNKLKHKLQAQDTVRLHKIHSIALILGVDTLRVTEVMVMLEHLEVVHRHEEAMTHERRPQRMVKL